MDDLEASVGSRVDEVSGSARAKPTDKQKPLSEKDKGTSTSSKTGSSIEKNPTNDTNLGSLSAKIDKLTDIVGEIVPVVHQLKTAYDDDKRSRGEIEGELLDGSLSEGDHQEINEDDLPTESALKDRSLTCLRGELWITSFWRLPMQNVLELPCQTK